MSADATSNNTPPLSSRLCDLMVAGLAGWTLLCHAVVLYGGSLFQLLIAAPIAAALAWIVCRRYRAPTIEESTAPPTDTKRFHLPGFAVAVALTIGFATSDRFHIFWWLTLGYLLIAYSTCLRGEAISSARPVASKSAERFTWCFALALAAVPLLVHKRSPDDSLYLNIAVSAADAPASPLFTTDTLHGIEGQGFLSSAYKVNSFELACGALSKLLGLSAIEVLHWVLPAIAALFLVLATARLLRHLAPETWPWCLAAALIALFALTSSPQSFGYFAFLRIHQGKGIFAGVFIPLLIAYAIEFQRQPDRRRWLLLCLVQIAAVGMTSTAIWAAPAITALTLAATSSFPRRGFRTLLVGIASSWYVLIAGAILAGIVLRETGTNLRDEKGISMVFFRKAPIHDGVTLVRTAWHIVLGQALPSAIALLATLSAWTFARRALTRRLFTLLPLGTLVFFLNPYTAMWVASKITVAPLYWRSVWLLPLPVMLAISCTAPLRLTAQRLGRGLTAAVLVTVLGVASFTQSFPTHLHWGAFLLKTNPSTYAHAKALAQSVAPRSYVLAARNVSTWVPTFHDHPYPLVSRENYLLIQRERLGEDEFRRRQRLHRFVSGTGQRSGLDELTTAVANDELQGVCFAVTPYAGAIRERLGRLGFHSVLADRQYETWIRDAR